MHGLLLYRVDKTIQMYPNVPFSLVPPFRLQRFAKNLYTSCSVLQELSGRVQRAMWSFGVEFAECSYVIKETPKHLQGSKCLNWTPFSWIGWYVWFYCTSGDYILYGIRMYTPVHYEMSDCPVWLIHTMNVLMAWTLDHWYHWSWSMINMKLITQKSPQFESALNHIGSAMKHIWILPWIWLWVCDPTLWCRRLSKRCLKCHGDRIMAVSWLFGTTVNQHFREYQGYLGRKIKFNQNVQGVFSSEVWFT